MRRLPPHPQRLRARSPSVTPVTALIMSVCLCQGSPLTPACCERPRGPAGPQRCPWGCCCQPPGAVGATRGCRAPVPGLRQGPRSASGPG